jgi:predicted 3-demethylubiquinone-9 3-methyltransferase (glyoxalase superfamily)
MAQKIITNLWFDDNAEEAAEFYASLFDDARIVSVIPYSEAAPGKAGSAMLVEFELAGQRFVGINGGPQFQFDEAISLQIDCEDQAEVDYFWERLTADGGEESQCGWCKDRFGLSWQVVPNGMEQFFAGDPERANRAMEAMFKMKKIDLAAMRRAADGE